MKYVMLIAGALAGWGTLAAQAPGSPPPCSESITANCAAPTISAARHDSAAAALARGWIALRSAGVDRFAAAHPSWDGRGVLIAILDSGIDPGIPGLGVTSDGAAKIVDLRDFSGEGRVALHPLVQHGDTLLVGSHRLLGAGHVAATAVQPTIWGGELLEAPLGKAPAADLNGNGVVGDSLPVVVAQLASGWAVFVDGRGEGTLADATPIRDFAVAHEYFGWRSWDPATHVLRAAPVNVAVNLADSAGTPQLDLFFDTGSHGSHVAGIAAGHDMYGVSGFDGVAPGARLIGAKIANDAHGGVSVTGAMVRALDYVIRYAHDHAMPLVVNLSFGVGNEIPGTARIDGLIDSMLAAHPDVPMTIAAGNDGPGLGTIGFPASASRAIAVGATLPLAFVAPGAPAALPEPLAFFSGRGGAIAAPDLVTPGVAFSTVPVFAIGDEFENGTSMAAPYAAGLLARLVSGLRAGQRHAPAAELRQALSMSAARLPSGAVVDQGFGLPNLSAAWEWLSRSHDVPQIAVDAGAVRGRAGVLLTTAPVAGAASLGARIILRRLDGREPLTVRLRASAPWLQLPETVSLVNGRGEFTLAISPSAANAPGEVTGVIDVEGPDETAGPLAQIPVTVRVTVPATGSTQPIALTAVPGGIGRVFIPADSDRGVQIRVAATGSSDRVTASLMEPDGMPFRDGPNEPAGTGDGAATFDVAPDDVVTGTYEVDMIASPLTAATATVDVQQSPFRVDGAVVRDTLVVSTRNLLSQPLALRTRAGLVGAGQTYRVVRSGDAPVRLMVPVPHWAAHVTVDTRMAPAQWSRFTDFGVSFLDRRGREFDTSPINYAFARATPDLPDSVVGDSMMILLSPAFASATDTASWTLDVRVRYYVEKPYSLDQGGSAIRSLAGGALREDRYPQSPLPIALPDGFDPVITVVALEGQNEGRIWAREISLPRFGGAP